MPELRGRYLIALKYLADVEADTRRSHQHELDGVAAVKELLGTPADVLRIPRR